MANRIYEFTVEGDGSFPATMLARDCCYPVHDSDVDSIFLRYEEVTDAREWLKPRRIQIRATRKPTKARWESFGWKIIEGRFV